MKTPGLPAIVSLVLCVLAACAADTVTPSVADAPAEERGIPLLTREAQIHPHLGQVVRVRGQALRAKLGDVIQSPTLSLYCTGERLPDELLETTVTVQGRLEIWDTGAREGPDGEISQGTPPGTRSTVLTDCRWVE